MAEWRWSAFAVCAGCISVPAAVAQEEAARLVYEVTSVRPALSDNLPTIFEAVKEQLGLELVRQKEPVDSLVIDSAERPTGN